MGFRERFEQRVQGEKKTTGSTSSTTSTAESYAAGTTGSTSKSSTAGTTGSTSSAGGSTSGVGFLDRFEQRVGGSTSSSKKSSSKSWGNNSSGLSKTAQETAAKYQAIFDGYDWKSTLEYDEWSDEDQARKKAGQLPKSIEKKYDMDDPVDVYLYSNGLPPKSKIASYAKQAETAKAKQAKEQAKTDAAAKEKSTQQQRVQNIIKNITARYVNKLTGVSTDQAAAFDSALQNGTAAGSTSSKKSNTAKEQASTVTPAKVASRNAQVDTISGAAATAANASAAQAAADPLALTDTTVEVVNPLNGQKMTGKATAGDLATKIKQAQTTRTKAQTYAEEQAEKAEKLTAYSNLSQNADWVDRVRKGASMPLSGEMMQSNPSAYEWDINSNDPYATKETGVHKYWDYFTTEEHNIYNYLRAEDEEAADEYYDLMLDTLKSRWTEDEVERARQYANVDVVGANIQSVFQGMAGAVKGAAYTAKQGVTEDTINPEDPAYSLNLGKQAIRQETGNKISNSTLRFLYDAGMSTADFAAMLPFGEAVSLSVMGAGSFADTAREASEKGATTEQALAMGAVAGAAEVLTEKMGVERIYEQIGSKAVNKPIKQMLLELGKSMASEGTEEVISEAANTVADLCIMGDKADLAEAVEQYKAAGKSDSEAKLAAIGDWLANDVLQSFAGGAVGGLMMSGPALSINKIATDIQVGRDVKKGGATSTVLDLALENGVISEKQYKQAQERVPSNRRLGSITQQALGASVKTETETQEKKKAELERIDGELAELSDGLPTTETEQRRTELEQRRAELEENGKTSTAAFAALGEEQQRELVQRAAEELGEDADENALFQRAFTGAEEVFRDYTPEKGAAAFTALDEQTQQDYLNEAQQVLGENSAFDDELGYAFQKAYMQQASVTTEEGRYTDEEYQEMVDALLGLSSAEQEALWAEGTEALGEDADGGELMDYVLERAAERAEAIREGTEAAELEERAETLANEAEEEGLAWESSIASLDEYADGGETKARARAAENAELSELGWDSTINAEDRQEARRRERAQARAAEDAELNELGWDAVIEAQGDQQTAADTQQTEQQVPAVETEQTRPAADTQQTRKDTEQLYQEMTEALNGLSERGVTAVMDDAAAHFAEGAETADVLEYMRDKALELREAATKKVEPEKTRKRDNWAGYTEEEGRNALATLTWRRIQTLGKHAAALQESDPEAFAKKYTSTDDYVKKQAWFEKTAEQRRAARENAAARKKLDERSTRIKTLQAQSMVAPAGYTDKKGNAAYSLLDRGQRDDLRVEVNTVLDGATAQEQMDYMYLRAYKMQQEAAERWAQENADIDRTRTRMLEGEGRAEGPYQKKTENAIKKRTNQLKQELRAAFHFTDRGFKRYIEKSFNAVAEDLRTTGTVTKEHAERLYKKLLGQARVFEQADTDALDKWDDIYTYIKAARFNITRGVEDDVIKDTRKRRLLTWVPKGPGSGTDVDGYYMEASNLWPDVFSDGIWNDSDQAKRFGEVMEQARDILKARGSYVRLDNWMGGEIGQIYAEKLELAKTGETQNANQMAALKEEADAEREALIGKLRETWESALKRVQKDVGAMHAQEAERQSTKTRDAITAKEIERQERERVDSIKPDEGLLDYLQKEEKAAQERAADDMTELPAYTLGAEQGTDLDLDSETEFERSSEDAWLERAARETEQERVAEEMEQAEELPAVEERTALPAVEEAEALPAAEQAAELLPEVEEEATAEELAEDEQAAELLPEAEEAAEDDANVDENQFTLFEELAAAEEAEQAPFEDIAAENAAESTERGADQREETRTEREKTSEIMTEREAEREAARDPEYGKRTETYKKRYEKQFVDKMGEVFSLPSKAKAELRAELSGIAFEAMRTGTLSEQVKNDMFEEMLEKGRAKNLQFVKELQDFADDARGVRFKSNGLADDTKRALPYQLPWDNKNGVGIEAFYTEMQKKYPGVLRDVFSMKDMATELSRTLGEIHKAGETLESYYTDEGRSYDSFKRRAYREFNSALYQLRKDLGMLDRYETARRNRQEEKELLAAAASDRHAVRAALDQRAMLRKALDNATARTKHPITEADWTTIRALEGGGISREQIQGQTNYTDIVRIAEAEKAYLDNEAVIKKAGALRREANAQKAAALLENSDNWKDKSTISFNRETAQRNMEDIAPTLQEGRELSQALFEPIGRHAAEMTRWCRDWTQKIADLHLSKEESALVQRMGENAIDIRALADGVTMADGSPVDVKKIDNAVQTFREFYADALQRANDTLTANGYEAVPKRANYFPHISEEVGSWQNFYQNVIKGGDMALPTAINGQTEWFRPGKPWFANFNERTGNKTDYDAVRGFEKYISGVSRVIFLTDDIQRLRSFDSALRQKYGMPVPDESSMDQKEYRGHLSNLAAWTNEYTNLLAGKTSKIDRAIESICGRRGLTLANWLKGRFDANAVGGNLSTAFSNFIPVTQGFATMKSSNMLAGMRDSMKNIIKPDGFAEQSDFLTRRFGQADKIATTNWEKVKKDASAAMNKPFELVDQFTAETLVRGKYREELQNGLSSEDAMAAADEYAMKTMADRSIGQMPVLFQSKTLGFLTQFQLEVNNQISNTFKDIPRQRMPEKGHWKEAAGKIGAALMKLFLASFLYNEVTEKYITGRRAAADPINTIAELARDLGVADGDGNAQAGTALANLWSNVWDMLPGGSIVTGGGRVPLATSLSDINPSTWITEAMDGDSGWTDDLKEWANNLATGYLLPAGGGQLKKTIKGVKAVAEGGAYSETDEGKKLKFYSDETATDYVKAALFGQYALPDAQRYADEGYASKGVKYTAAFDGLRSSGMDAETAMAQVDSIQATKKESDGTYKARVQLLQATDLTEKQKKILDRELLASERGAADYSSEAWFGLWNEGSKTYQKAKKAELEGIDGDTYWTLLQEQKRLKGTTLKKKEKEAEFDLYMREQGLDEYTRAVAADYFGF